MSTSTSLVPSLDVGDFVRRRDAVVTRVLDAHASLAAADALARELLASERVFALDLLTHDRRQFQRHVDEVIAAVDANAWDRLMHLSGMLSLLDETARDEWDKGLREHKMPPLTVDNVYATFRRLHDEKQAMFERGVIEVFRSLSWKYRTNTPVAFGKRLVVRGVVDHRFNFGPSFDGCRALDDLLRVLHVLDGVPAPDHRNGVYHRLRALKWPASGSADLEYFTIRGFKNGNGHLTFCRADLVDKMNAILAAHYERALPAR